MAGNTLYLTEAVYISASSTPPLGSSGISGGGGYGSGGTMLRPGVPPGTRTNSTGPKEPVLRRVLDDERRGAELHFKAKYKPLNEALPAKTKAESEQAKKRSIKASMNASERAKAQQLAVIHLIQSKRKKYLSLLPIVNSLYGSSPFYKRTDSFITRMIEVQYFGDPSTIFHKLDATTEAAHQAYLLDESIRLLSTELPKLSQERDSTNNASTATNWSTELQLKNRIIQDEQVIYFEQLPAFLQIEITTKTADTSKLDLNKSIASYITTINSLCVVKRKQIVPAKSSNKSIVSPLAKTELEALRSLVEEQRLKRAGPLWADYHLALMLTESIRHLERTAASFALLKARAEQVARLSAQQQAKEAADLLARQKVDAAQKLAKKETEETARRAEELARQHITFASIGSAVGSTIWITPIGSASINLPHSAYHSVQGAIRTAIAGLSANSLAVGAGFVAATVVGFFSLLWPSSLGNGERHTVTSVPLSDLGASSNCNLQAIAQANGSIDLPYTLHVESGVEATRLIVASSAGTAIASVSVITATYDKIRHVYSVALNNPERILTWTPVKAPGDESMGSTSLPVSIPASAVYEGTLLSPIEVEAKTYPALDVLELERLIVTFPIDSGIEPILVVFNRPRDWRYFPNPRKLTAFPNAINMHGKTKVLGGGKLRRRWKDSDGSILEWDSQHGKVEKYNSRGQHLGEFDPESGIQTKPADPKRRIEP